MNTLPDSESPQSCIPLKLNRQTIEKLFYLAKKANMPTGVYADALLEDAVKNTYDLCNSTYPGN